MTFREIAVSLLAVVNPFPEWPGLAAILIAAVALPAMRAALDGGPRSIPRWAMRAGAACVVVLALVQFSFVALYLFYPTYLIDTEAAVAEIAWLGWNGGAYYPPIGAGDVYGLPYGPVLFQAVGAFLWALGPSVVASKLVGILAFPATTLLTLLLARRAGASRAEAVAVAGIQCLVLAGFGQGQYAFASRGDIPLTLVAAAALVAATGRPSASNAIWIGLLAGIATNLKIHGAVYVLPSLALILSRAETSPARARLAAIAGAAALVASVLPFASGGVSTRAYSIQLLTALHERGTAERIAQNLVLAAMLAGPSVWILCTQPLALPRRLLWFLGTTAAAVAIGAAVGSIHGYHHLLPFLPPLCWTFLRLDRLARDAGAGDRLRVGKLALLASFLLGFTPLILREWGHTATVYLEAPQVRAAVAEVEAAIAANPGLKIAVGPGDGPGFDVMLLRVIPVFRGNPMPLDPTTWEFLQSTGASEAEIVPAIRGCRVDLWLFARDAAFVATNYQTLTPMFSDETRTIFRAAYRRDHAGEVFEQWRCRHRAGG